MSIRPKEIYQYSEQAGILFLSFCAFLMSVAAVHATASVSVAPARISYRSQPSANRTLIFSNNPEYLWNNQDICDLADEPRRSTGPECRNTLLNVESVQKGNYRTWWEHRNMMPFIIQSALVFENKEKETAVIEVTGIHLETNSKKNGGREFASLLNNRTSEKKIVSIKTGERIVLQDVNNKRVFPGHYFAGVSDFSIMTGSVSLSEIVFRKNIAAELRNSNYEQRNHLGVRESLVYKGISTISSVELTGATFTIDDTTQSGPLPVAYHKAEILPDTGYCHPNMVPACSGGAITKSLNHSEHSSWVTHIAPDPADPNPKRARAIVDDLVSLVLPASNESCPSAWPMPDSIAENHCFVMSANLRWFLPDVQKWRLPNWGNWAIQYKHPVTITNSGHTARLVRLVVTADGESPIAFRGTGISDSWIQFFLTNRSSNPLRRTLTLAETPIAAGETKTLESEFILAGPAAGTLEHHIELSE